MINCQFEDGCPVKLRHACVDVIVLRDNKILLLKRAAKYPGMPEVGKWGLVGGYMDRVKLLFKQ
jgi:ADP-ribose pyrophosphatase YjhB (NUDIX family)